QVADLRRPQAVAVGDQEHGRIPMPVAAMLSGAVYPPLNLALGGVSPLYCQRSAASIRLSPPELDHFAPLLGFLSDQLAEVSGRTRKHRATEVSEPRFHVGIGEAGIDLLVELVDDFDGRVFWRADPYPAGRLIARHELSHGRDVRQRVRARLGADCARAQPTPPH